MLTCVYLFNYAHSGHVMDIDHVYTTPNFSIHRMNDIQFGLSGTGVLMLFMVSQANA